jgi:hypothetical protein
MSSMTSRELEEYKALRATIRQRGTSRVWVFVTGLALWGGLVLATAASMPTPVATLLPLLELAAAFEAVFALHTGVERIGRYIQVFYEGEPGDPHSSRRWEHTAMAFGRTAPGGGTDPLFTALFALATVCNFVPALLAAPVAIEGAVVGSLHLVFVGRLIVARRRSARQRATDLERFQALKESETRPTAAGD